MTEPRGWLHPCEVAEHLSCTRQHVYDLVAQGQLEAIKMGKRAIRVSRISLDGFIAKMKVQPSEQV